jgi:hypothetical protein
MSSKLMEYFNRQPRLGTLSTSARDGKVNVAVFGSPRMIEEKLVFMGIGKNRSLSYLEQNPYAVYMIIEPGKALTDWKGIRIYLKVKDIATSGTIFDTYKSQLAKEIGDAAAGMIHAGVTFEVIEVRPIVDMGQGWEKSI